MDLNLKNGIFIFLLALASQAYGLQTGTDNTFAFADLLAWKLREGAADNWAEKIPPSGSSQPISILGVPFKYSPGVRLGIGRTNLADGWDTVFSYTWFHTVGKSQASVTTGGIYSPFLGNFFINNVSGANFGPNYRNASVRWKLNLNIVDLEFGRPIKIDDYLMLRPFVGLKGGTIYQYIYSTWQNPTTATTFTSATENLKNNFWGIGPVIGLDTKWPIYKNVQSKFNLIGNFSGAVMWGHWGFTDQYQNNTPATSTVHVSNIIGAATMARALIGVEWIRSFSKTKMTIHLGYEAQIWFNQIQFYSLNMGRLNNLMSLQGGVLGLSVQL